MNYVIIHGIIIVRLLHLLEVPRKLGWHYPPLLPHHQGLAQSLLVLGVGGGGEHMHALGGHLPLRLSRLSCTNSIQFGRSVTSDSLQPHEPQHARPPCPSSTP